MKRFNLITGTVMALAITTGTVQAQQFVDKKTNRCACNV